MMKCATCGTTILDGLGKATGGYCKPCAKLRNGAVEPSVRPEAPAKETTMALGEPVPQIAPSPPLPTPPEGFRYVYNRTDQVFEPFFDGNPVIFQPHETKMLPCGTAEMLRDSSVFSGTVRSVGQGTLKGERALALGPGWIITDSRKLDDESWTYSYAPADAEPTFLVPTDTQNGPEWFDRASVPNYVNRPSRENIPTTAKLIHV